VEHVEQVVLLDADRRPVGTMPKIAAQSAHTPLHLAFSVYAFGSDGRFLAWVGWYHHVTLGSVAYGFLTLERLRRPNRRRRPDPVAAARPEAGPAGLLGRRLSGVQASRAMVATPNETTRPRAPT
jgi:hypothetical protein